MKPHLFAMRWPASNWGPPAIRWYCYLPGTFVQGGPTPFEAYCKWKGVNELRHLGH